MCVKIGDVAVTLSCVFAGTCTKKFRMVKKRGVGVGKLWGQII